MENERLKKGLEKLKEGDGKAVEDVIASMKGLAPDLGRYIAEFAIGDIYSRDGLSMQEKEMIILTSLLTAGGCEAQLEIHINISLNVGVSPDKIIEIFIQCLPYAGFPRVINAVGVAGKVFKGKNISIK